MTYGNLVFAIELLTHEAAGCLTGL